MADRRSFFAQLTGLIAGLVASKLPAAKPTGTVIQGSDLRLWDAEGRQVYPPLYETPLRTSCTWCGGTWHGVTVNGKTIGNVHSVEDYGYPHRGDGSFWGNVTAFTPTNEIDPDEWVSRFDGVDWSEYKYIGWVKVARWPEWGASWSLGSKVKDWTNIEGSPDTIP